MIPSRILRFWVLFVGLLALSASAYAQRPNIVLIVADDLGYGDLSSYGADDIETPHIDGLVRDGMRFDRFYANSPVCSPTRAFLLTGRYPDMVGVPGVVRTTAASDRTLVFVRREGNDKYLGLAYYAVMKGDWKLLQNTPTQPFELYNLASDPREERNVIDEHDSIFRDLAEDLRLHILASGTIPWRER